MEKILKTDLQNYTFLSALRLINSATAVVCASKASLDENKYLSDLYQVDLKTGKSLRLTSRGDARSFAAMGENSVIFPAIREDSDCEKIKNGENLTVFYKLNLDGGEAQECFRLPLASASAVLVSDGIYLVKSVFDNARPDFETMKPAARREAMEKYHEEQDYEICDEAPFWANGRGFTNKKRNRIYIYDVNLKKLTPITDPMFETRAVCFSPSGDFIAFSGALTDKKLNMFCGIYMYDLETGKTRELFASNKYSGVYSMEFLGDKIMFAAEEHGADYMEFGGTKLYSVSCQTGEVRMEIAVSKTEDFGGNAGSDCRYGGGITMKAAGDKLYYVSNYAHQNHINVWRDGQEAMRLTTNDSIGADFFDFLGDTMLSVGFEGDSLQECFLVDMISGEQTSITSFNKSALKNKYVATPQPLIFKNTEGSDIEGWVLLPKDYDPKKPYPAMLDIHGGPRATFGTNFFHQMQVMASDGCFVMYCNPTGSGGRGDSFADISGLYGTVDYDDLMMFTDRVLQKYPAIDENRLGVLGGSYGGFMCNWIIGKNQRFAAAASQRSIASWITLYGTCDIGLTFDLREVQATPFTDMYKMWDQSPLKFADKAKTPTLFINSTEDYRCWLPEGISMYTALQLNGVDSRMCIFKGENHELSRSGKPLHRLRRLDEITSWLYKYTM